MVDVEPLTLKSASKPKRFIKIPVTESEVKLPPALTNAFMSAISWSVLIGDSYYSSEG